MDPTSSVATLVSRARGGDQDAWDEIVERFLPLVGAVVRRHRLAPGDADDVRQTVWLRLVEHLDGLREPAALPGWIATTARNECLRVLQSSARQRPVDHDDLDLPPTPDESADAVIAAERTHALRAALAELPASRRDLLLLLLTDPPVPYVEISERLGIPVGSIGPTRARALEQLRGTRALRALADHPEQPARTGEPA